MSFKTCGLFRQQAFCGVWTVREVFYGFVLGTSNLIASSVESFAAPGYYAAYGGICLPTFRNVGKQLPAYAA
jgi:hypothetical protein